MTKLGLNDSFGPRIRLVSMTVVPDDSALALELDPGSEEMSGSSVLMGLGPDSGPPFPLPRACSLSWGDSDALSSSFSSLIGDSMKLLLVKLVRIVWPCRCSSRLPRTQWLCRLIPRQRVAASRPAAPVCLRSGSTTSRQAEPDLMG